MSETPQHAADAAQRHYDVALVGGGLANGLIALMLIRAHPHLKIAIIERNAEIGGNHTWSFHTTDVDAAAMPVLEPLIDARWPDQEIRFPSVQRVIATGYNTMTSQRLRAALEADSRIDKFLSVPVAELRSDGVLLEDGRRIGAHCVIDGRGAVPTDALALGYQKFVGLEVETVEPHGEIRPVIMDATVEQHDGYRFVYTLPFSANLILVEDTYYSDGPELDIDLLTRRAEDYAAKKGWRIAKVVRREHGILPITLAGDIEKFWAEADSAVARSGMRACLFHPTTGYSVPDAVLLAQRLADLDTFETATVDRQVRRHSYRCWQRRSFFRMLNRMLFLAAKGDERRAVLERFYTLPAPLIERFYAARITYADQARILMGRPPLPIPRAMKHLSETTALANWTGAKQAANG